MEDLKQLLQETVDRYVLPRARIVSIEPEPMGAHERGWSGDIVRRYRVIYDNLEGDAEIVSLLTKTALLKERRVLELLSEQGHANVPYTHSLDLHSDARMLVCLQDLGGERLPLPDDFDRQVAKALAAIHYRNLGTGNQLPWLPRADRAYFEDFLVKEVWRANWLEALENPDFAREFASYTPLLDEAAAHFVAEMDALYREGTSLTVTHGDMHPIQDGHHVLLYHCKPYFIDWGWTYYGSFYLDLPNYFTPATVPLYRDALAELGLDIPLPDFMQRYYATYCYVGFKYLCAGIWNWSPGPTEQTGKILLPMLKKALGGIINESGFTVSDATWQHLLDEHKSKV